MKVVNRWLSFAAISMLFAIYGVAPSSAAEFPNKPIRILLAFPPGAVTDLSIRLLQPFLEEQLGQPILVDYKPGAGGALAAQEVSRSEPDGYTVLLAAANSFTIDRFMWPARPDPMSSLVPLAKYAEVPNVLFTSTALRASDWKTLVTQAKEKKLVLNFGTPGVGTTPHLSALLLKKMSGLDINHIPFKGSQPAIQALVGGDLQLYMGGYAPLLPFITEGRATPLAVVADKRLVELPSVPTASEAGIPAALANNWFALALRAGTPPSVVARLLKALDSAASNPTLQKKFQQNGLLASSLSGADLQAAIADESNKWRDLIATENLAGKD